MSEELVNALIRATRWYPCLSRLPEAGDVVQFFKEDIGRVIPARYTEDERGSPCFQSLVDGTYHSPLLGCWRPLSEPPDMVNGWSEDAPDE